MPNYKSNPKFDLFPPNFLEGNPKLGAILETVRKKNNPHNEHVGIFTGRCEYCGSNDLWDDNMAYGCNYCGSLLGTNN